MVSVWRPEILLDLCAHLTPACHPTNTKNQAELRLCAFPKRFYLIGGGIPIIVCGITAAANIRNYGSRTNAP